MSTREDRLPFWLLLLVAGTVTFVFVVLLGLIFLRPRPASAPGPGSLSPEMSVIQQAIAAYFEEHGRLPGELEVPFLARPTSRPATMPRSEPGTRPAAAQTPRGRTSPH